MTRQVGIRECLRLGGLFACPIVLTTLVLVGTFAATGCESRDAPAAGQPSAPAAGPPRVLAAADLSAAERLYGHAPTPSPEVTYRPDVYVLPSGANAIRGVSSDGLVWTIDPAAPGADKVVQGQVLFLTNRAVGRVLAVQKRESGLEVVLGPVEITEVIHEGRFAIETPVDFDGAQAFTAPDLPGASSAVPPLMGRFGDVPLGMLISPARFSDVTVHRFRVTPLVGARGIGVRIKSSAGGVQFLGEAVLYLTAPKLRFHLDISNARINTCEVELSGAAGLLMTFESTSERGVSANVNERVEVPVDFSIPIVGMGVPFAVNVRQTFELKTAFTARGALKARGYYSLAGGLSVGYKDGKFSVAGPSGLTPKESLLQSTEGVSMGIAGLVMSHKAQVIVGIGAFGFATGPYVNLTSTVAVSRGSDIGIVVCRGATLSMALAAGVGYAMPQPVTRAINVILRGLNLGEIKGSGGFQTPAQMLVNTSSYTPKLKICEI